MLEERSNFFNGNCDDWPPDSFYLEDHEEFLLAMQKYGTLILKDQVIRDVSPICCRIRLLQTIRES